MPQRIHCGGLFKRALFLTLGLSNRNVEIHREWMVRSYAITTTFVTTRILTAIPAIGGGGEAISVPAQWSLLVVMMVLVELGLVWRTLFVNNRRRRVGAVQV